MINDQGEEPTQHYPVVPNQSPHANFSHSPSPSDAELLELDFDKIDDSKPYTDNDWNDVDRAPQTSIKVLCRLRPRFNNYNRDSEFWVPPSSIFKNVEKCYVELFPPLEKNGNASYRSVNRNTKTNRYFHMDHVFSENTTQTEVFTRVGLPCLESVFQGINSTILAYGQTGSGKTYTLLGGAESLNISPSQSLDPTTDSIPPFCGLIPRLILHCFFKVEELSTNYNFTIRLSIIEIYNEVINDLITGKCNLKSYHTFIPKSFNSQFQPFNDFKPKSPSSDKFYIKDLSEHIVESPEEACKLLNQALNNRKIAYTKSNAESSRSHLIFMLEVKQVNKIDGTRKTSTMYIVDLAGSEKAETSTSTINMQEGKMINKSLTCLSKVVHLLSIMASDKNKLISHIPYRDSKLTQILKNSLGGDSKTYFILNCSMEYSNYYESLFTLRFGQRAKHVKNLPVVNSEATPLPIQSQLKSYQNLLHHIVEWSLMIFLYTSGNIDMKIEQTQNLSLINSRSKQMSLLPSYIPSKGTFTSYSYTPQTSFKDCTPQYSEFFVNRYYWEALWNSLPTAPDSTFDYIFDDIKSKLLVSDPNEQESNIRVRIKDQSFENFRNNAQNILNGFIDPNSKHTNPSYDDLKKDFVINDQELNDFSAFTETQLSNDLDSSVDKTALKETTNDIIFVEDNQSSLSNIGGAHFDYKDSESLIQKDSQDPSIDKENIDCDLQPKSLKLENESSLTTSIFDKSSEIQESSDVKQPHISESSIENCKYTPNILENISHTSIKNHLIEKNPKSNSDSTSFLRTTSFSATDSSTHKDNITNNLEYNEIKNELDFEDNFNKDTALNENEISSTGNRTFTDIFKHSSSDNNSENNTLSSEIEKSSNVEEYKSNYNEECSNHSQEEKNQEQILQKRSPVYNILFKFLSGVVSLFRFIITPKKSNNILGIERLRLQHTMLSNYSYKFHERSFLRHNTLHTTSITDDSLQEILSNTLQHNIELLEILETYQIKEK